MLLLFGFKTVLKALPVLTVSRKYRITCTNGKD